MMRAMAMLLLWMTLLPMPTSAQAPSSPPEQATAPPVESVQPDNAVVKGSSDDPAKTETRARARIREVLTGPVFTAEETIRIPKLKDRPEQKSSSDWMRRVEKFFRWVAEVLRSGVWILAGIGVLVLLFTLHYWWRVSGQEIRSEEVSVPTHVGGLDIRPESLPEDVGAAALLRWQSGDAVGSLSLLYRGALSVLVGRYGADIRSSSTESECVRAARPCLSSVALAYFAGLTNIWQLTVYAARRPGDSAMQALCAEFSSHFAQQAAAGELTGGESQQVAA